MPFFCSCRICKANSKNGDGRILYTKKTFKKHQKKEKDRIQENDETEATEIESIDGSMSSCNVIGKRKFEDDELGESDINSTNSLLDDDSLSDNDILFSVPLNLEDESKR